MQETLLDFAEDNQLAGFRLQQLQVYNWGTFNDGVKSLKLDGQNTLLTGDIGSGKSTLVDAVTTLLVPAHRIAYNKAAGAAAKERSLRSYVMGYFRSTRSESGLNQQDSLRDQNSYSVILGQFYNEGFDQWASLAQVFWLKDGQNQPAKMFIVAEKPLTIVEHFSNFGSDIRALRKQLQQQTFTEVFDSYTPYAGSFRRRFGIKNEQALELFHQTVSMKQVGNLTEFVREHMLESYDALTKVEKLIAHFEDLNRSHELVLKAKSQIELLKPMVEQGKKYNLLQKQVKDWELAREALTGFFAEQKLSLLAKRQQAWQKELQFLQVKITSLNNLKPSQQSERDDLKQAIANEGGDRLAKLQKQISDAEISKNNCQKKQQKYFDLLSELELPSVDSLEKFQARSEQITALASEIQEQKADLENQKSELDYLTREQNNKIKDLQDEVVSLKLRKNNIDAKQIKIRALLCSELGLDEEDLPFIGELLQLREDELEWEGAVERILHNFALSLLVPDSHYNQVSEWVERTHLKGRLVYYRVTGKGRSLQDISSSHVNSLVRKIMVKPESQFYNWLMGELIKRFDYACCQEMTDFRREKFAVTLQGQVKAANNRHEKNDSHAITDRRFFVLGWSNQQKIALLEKQGQALAIELAKQAQELDSIVSKIEVLVAKIQSCSTLNHYQDFKEIDWQIWAKQIDSWLLEKAELEASHNRLKSLQIKLESHEKQMRETDLEAERQNKAEGGCSIKIEACKQDIVSTNSILAEQKTQQNYTETLAERLMKLQVQWKLKQVNQVEHIAKKESEFRNNIQSKISNTAAKNQRLRDKVNGLIKDFRHDYPEKTNEFLADIEGLDDYSKYLKTLLSDDLPRFSKRFKEQLNANAINQISHFKMNLIKSQQQIEERIDKINQSLSGIEYNSNRYIKLELVKNTDSEIRDFYLSLEACVEGSFTDSDNTPYAEAKFLQVKALIDRFKGREGLQDLDKKWTKKVTDVRNFYLFSASERWLETNEEHEHYSDSAGKSGGQKEKLAYTVLAASLAYQFGLEVGEVKSRSFRFVVIDEAFGRGSDESAKYGLELFQKLNLQLLVITPKQKIHVIEPFVSHVGFVSSPEGRESYLRTLSIDEHLTKKAEYKKLQKRIEIVE